MSTRRDGPSVDGPLGDARDGVAHLQAAALELIAAARAFLDAAEATISDPDHARRAAATLAAVIGAFADPAGPTPPRGEPNADGHPTGGLRRIDVS